MTLQVSYMGTKKQLASYVSDLVDNSKPGPFLDLFSGVCAVGESIRSGRQVWCNDIQLFSYNIARAFFTSKAPSLTSIDALRLIVDDYDRNFSLLQKKYGRHLLKERSLIKKKSIRDFKKFNNELLYHENCPEFELERRRLSRAPLTKPYRLFTMSYSGGYLGLEQCFQIDSLRFGIDQALEKRFINPDEHRWMILALCQSMSKVATTSGHFAQYLQIKSSNKRFFHGQRQRFIMEEWLSALDTFAPIGNHKWRAQNKVFQQDSVSLLKRLSKKDNKPSVIYADPPYTSDQYSRYYHLYETLLRYDYPAVSSKGLYRHDRFRSDFSLQSKVESAFENLIQSCSNLGTELIISYPENGLLEDSKQKLLKMLRKNFSNVKVAHEIPYKHSSLGASKGKEKYNVTEILYKAK